MGEDGKQAKTGARAGGGLLMTSAEAAALLGMSVRGFRRAVERTGTLKRHPASGRFRSLWSRARVLAWAAEEVDDEE